MFPERFEILKILRLKTVENELNENENINDIDYLMLQGIISKNNTNTDEKNIYIVDAKKLISNPKKGKGNFDTGDVYYLKKGELFYKKKNKEIVNIGFAFNDIAHSTKKDIFTYEDNRKTILTGIDKKFIKIINRENVLQYEIFVDEERITDITIPKNVRIIKSSAFLNYVSLEMVRFQENLEKIEDYSFGNCISLKLLNIPKKVTSIGDYAFINCEDLHTVEIENGLSNIGESAFENCSSLKSINIPSSVTNIGDSAFAYCESLNNIKVDKENKNYVDIDGVLFNKEVSKLIQYPLSKPDIDYVIPSGTVSVEKNAFTYCKFLKSIIIPDSVETIASNAFYKVENIKFITNKNNLLEIPKDNWGAGKIE